MAALQARLDASAAATVTGGPQEAADWAAAAGLRRLQLALGEDALAHLRVMFGSHSAGPSVPNDTPASLGGDDGRIEPWTESVVHRYVHHVLDAALEG